MNPMKATIDQPSRPRKTPQAMSLTLILMRGSEVGKTSGGSVNAGLLWPGVRPYQGRGPPLRGDSGVSKSEATTLAKAGQSAVRSARGSFTTEGQGWAPLPPTPEDSPGPAIRHKRTRKTLSADKIAKESG